MVRRTIIGLGVVLGAALTACGGSGTSTAVISATPSVGLWDQARTVVISNLTSRELVTVTARSQRPDGLWTASATFRADTRGFVDIADEAPIAGSYQGISPMGLLWSEHLSAGGTAPLNGITATTLTVSADKHLLASTRLLQLLSGPGVRERSERVATRGFFGQYFTTTVDRTRRPAVILWGGSEGGLGTTAHEAALLASHEIPALAIAYFDEPGLPCRMQDIPLEYFVRAIRWLRSQPQVDPDRVWILSGSRGTEAELLVAAHWPTLVHGVVAESPSLFVNGAYSGDCPATGASGLKPAWTLNGGPLANSSPIPVQRISGQVLLVTGGNDLVWPSGIYAGRIMSSLPHDRAAHVRLNYPTAGHLVLAIPYAPIARGELADGGTVAGDSAAYISDWPATLSFITSH